MNTLRYYANRAKTITNHVTVNVDPDSKIVHNLRDRVKALLATELVIVPSTGDFRDGGYTYPFGMDWLDSLIHGGIPGVSFVLY